MSVKEEFLREYTKELRDDNAALFIGAGISQAAGYPSWLGLLQEIGRDLKLEIDESDDLAAIAQWSIERESKNRTKIWRLIREKIEPERPIPDSLKIISRLPIRHIWTTNYDRLIERAFAGVQRPTDVRATQASLTMRGAQSGAVRVYKMHGSIHDIQTVVISTDDFELFRKNRGGFLPLLQAHMTSMSFLFMGMSFNDPNIRHMLGVIRENFPDSAPEHFAIVRKPQPSDFRPGEESRYEARAIRYSHWVIDLKRYGLKVIEIDDYAEIDSILLSVERSVARSRVWVSGSWPPSLTKNTDNVEINFINDISIGLGELVSRIGRTLVSGSGLVVGSGSVSGLITGLQKQGSWDLHRRLVARPFPQPLEGRQPDGEQWKLLRRELARAAGIVVFVSGIKIVDGQAVTADGVLQERDIAIEEGCFLIPIGATGGAAAQIAKELVGSSLPFEGSAAQRPTDAILARLSDKKLSATELVETVRLVIENIPR